MARQLPRPLSTTSDEDDPEGYYETDSSGQEIDWYSTKRASPDEYEEEYDSMTDEEDDDVNDGDRYYVSKEQTTDRDKSGDPTFANEFRPVYISPSIVQKTRYSQACHRIWFFTAIKTDACEQQLQTTLCDFYCYVVDKNRSGEDCLVGYIDAGSCVTRMTVCSRLPLFSITESQDEHRLLSIFERKFVGKYCMRKPNTSHESALDVSCHPPRLKMMSNKPRHGRIITLCDHFCDAVSCAVNVFEPMQLLLNIPGIPFLIVNNIAACLAGDVVVTNSRPIGPNLAYGELAVLTRTMNGYVYLFSRIKHALETSYGLNVGDVKTHEISYLGPVITKIVDNRRMKIRTIRVGVYLQEAGGKLTVARPQNAVTNGDALYSFTRLTIDVLVVFVPYTQSEMIVDGIRDDINKITMLSANVIATEKCTRILTVSQMGDTQPLFGYLNGFKPMSLTTGSVYGMGGQAEYFCRHFAFCYMSMFAGIPLITPRTGKADHVLVMDFQSLPTRRISPSVYGSLLAQNMKCHTLRNKHIIALVNGRRQHLVRKIANPQAVEEQHRQCITECLKIVMSAVKSDTLGRAGHDLGNSILYIRGINGENITGDTRKAMLKSIIPVGLENEHEAGNPLFVIWSKLYEYMGTRQVKYTKSGRNSGRQPQKKYQNALMRGMPANMDM